MTSTCDAATGMDLLRTSVDLSQYLDQKPTTPVLPKSRKPLLIHSLKRQLNKTSRFLSLLSSKPPRPSSIPAPSPIYPIKFQTPSTTTSSSKAPSQTPLAIKSIKISRTPKPVQLNIPVQIAPNQANRNLATPLNIQLSNLNSISSFSSTPIHIKSKVFKPYKNRLKIHSKKTSENHNSFDKARGYLSPYVKKRRLSGEEGNMSVFDIRDILNVTNGVIVIH